MKTPFKKELDSARLIALSLRTPKKDFLILFFFSLAVAVSEGLGVSLLYPVLQYVSRGIEVFTQKDSSTIWNLFTSMIDHLHLPHNLATLLAICLIPILLRQIFFYVNFSYAARVQYHSVAGLQTQCFENLSKADLSFFEKTSKGRLTSSITLESVRSGILLFIIFQILSGAVLLGAYSFFIFLLSPKLTLMAFGTFLIIEFLIKRQIRISEKFGEEVSEKNDQFGHLINEKLETIRLTRLHNSETKEMKNFRQVAFGLADRQADIYKKNAGVQVIVEPVFIIGAFTILYIAKMFLNMNLASVGIFLFVLLRMLPIAKQVHSHRQLLSGYQSSILNVLKVIQEAQINTRIKSGPVAFESLNKGISFKNAVFAYDPEKPVLISASFSIPAGKTTAIVGHSGAGKSTITDILLRLRDVDQGEVLFDDVPLKQLNLASLYQSIGYVSQNTILLNDTVGNNLTYGLENYSKSDIKAAARMSHAFEFIQKLPKKFDTVIGDRGMSLSGGERQRLCLARALLRHPSILILDEPTSALDAESEKYIQETIHQIKSNLTMIIIAHRFSTIRDADQILVLKDGHIEDVGSHQELIQKSDFYNRLFKIQMNT